MRSQRSCDRILTVGDVPPLVEPLASNRCTGLSERSDLRTANTPIRKAAEAMFIDAREVEFGTALKSDVCIVGGGLAGLTLARALARKGVRVCLVESGGFRPDAETSSLSRTEQPDLGDGPLLYKSWRVFGGRMQDGEGICHPLDEQDFAAREWIPHSGWPFSRTALDGYYDDARMVLRIGTAEFDVKTGVAELGRRDLRRPRLPADRVVDRLMLYSPLRRVRQAFRREIETSDRLTVVLHATAVELETDASAQTVQRLTAVTLRGRKLFAIARHYVLATGAIENARLLLLSNRVQATGLGNGHDLVGRFLMDHPQIRVGEVRFSHAWKDNKLYDNGFRQRVKAVDGGRFTAHYALSPGLQQRERLLNGLVWLSSHFGRHDPDVRRALFRWKHAATGRPPFRALMPLISSLLGHPLDVLRLAAGAWLGSQWLRAGVQFHMVVEPAPNRESRILLGDNLDPLGMKRVRMYWRPGDQVRRTVTYTLSVLAEELRRAGVVEAPTRAGQEAGPPADHGRALEGSGHHLGTTRMHDSPKHGVVDRNGRVHGMQNLFIAGASVFPTAGAVPPTMTVVALALRMADQLTQQLKHPHVRLRPVP